jgi:hypothetical protein
LLAQALQKLSRDFLKEQTMKTQKRGWLTVCGMALCGSLLMTPIVQSQSTVIDGEPVKSGSTPSNNEEGGRDEDGVLRAPATKPNHTAGHSPTTNSVTKPPPGSDERADMMLQNGNMVVDTISEEKTEIAALKAQAAALRKMGGSQNLRLARLWDRMRREHEAASPALMKLAKKLGNDPTRAKVIKAPVLGDTKTIVHAAHMAHEKAVQTSQMRWKMSNHPQVRAAMHKRATLARKHIRWMKPYHDRLMKM